MILFCIRIIDTTEELGSWDRGETNGMSVDQVSRHGMPSASA